MKVLTAIAEWMKPRAKAVAGGLATGVLMLLAMKSGGLTFDELVDIVITSLFAAGVTYATPNVAQAMKDARKSNQS